VSQRECIICGEPIAPPRAFKTCKLHRLTKSECSRLGGIQTSAKRRAALEALKIEKLRESI
jgi:hypothetical protein